MMSRLRGGELTKVKQKLWPTLKRLLAYGSSWRKSLIFGVMMLWIAAAAEVAGPALVSYFISHLVEKSNISLALSGGLAAIYIVLQLFSALLHYMQSLLFNHIAVGVVQQLRIHVMDAALRQPLSTFDAQPVGQLISQVTNDTEVVHDLYITVVSTVLRSMTLISVMLVAMFMLDYRMAMITLMIFPSVAIVMAVYQHLSTPIIQRLRCYLADINDGFNEAITGMSVIQQFRQQARFGEKIGASSRAHFLARMQTLRLDGMLLRPLLNLLSATVLCVLLIQFKFSSVGTVGVGVLYAFISYLGRLNEPLIMLTTQQSILQQAVVAGERIFEIMDAAQQSYGDDMRPLAGGSIEMKNVSFAYRDNQRVLNHISLQVPECGFVALVGHTGSGKSTLASLLMGYYAPHEGEICLDGRPLVSLSRHVLRQNVAIVQQDPIVLADSLYANVALGRDIPEAQVWRVLDIVQLSALVKALNEGIHTTIGEQGNTLSVGQKQLISLARVLVKPPKILILDEATANIDSGTEQAVQRALRLIRQQTTLVVIAHRLSTVVEADNILVLHHGEAVERGTHEQLLQRHGRYYQMHQLQLTGQELVASEDKSISFA
ncbi:MAG: SmdB family multidrug efflux ABC transporter permease/ATP-binding protein [Candidatus Malihini olakiniferum]